jgi:branched-chain amino acid transport system substrate-binding protein
MYEAYAPGERDYSELVSRLHAANIDVVYIGGYSSEAGLIVRQARDRGYGAQVVSGDALTNEEFWMITGPAGAGTLVTFGPDPRANAEAGPVVKQFRDQGFDPSGYTLHTYAAVRVWAEAVEKAGSLDLEPVVKSLRSDAFQTVLGEINFDENGDVTAPGYVWYVWNNGEYVPFE